MRSFWQRLKRAFWRPGIDSIGVASFSTWVTRAWVYLGIVSAGAALGNWMLVASVAGIATVDTWAMANGLKLHQRLVKLETQNEEEDGQ